MSLPDLVKTKKTQRDKACPMIRRLLEADYFANRDHPSVEQLKFWMLELRTPQLLIEVVASNRELAGSLEDSRPLLRLAAMADERSLAESLLQEELHIREKDREYWRPLKAELEKLRLDRPRP
ncbi:MAG TPA: hypothetical protein DEP46_02745 [Blastocatellia bacterium]|nr:hypothetical protein [Blastocatellia bacterium]